MRRTVHLDLEPDHHENAVARRIARAALEQDHATGDQIDDAVLITSELFTNAVHATVDDEQVSVSVTLSDDDIVVRVSNRGPTFDLPSTPAQPTDEGGRGLEMARLIGETTISHEEGITTVSVDIALADTSDPCADAGTDESEARLRPASAGQASTTEQLGGP
jgi:anti-sigma regulatory factor (Ser/Thr protein kinase)